MKNFKIFLLAFFLTGCVTMREEALQLKTAQTDKELPTIGYRIESKIYINGELISSPRITTYGSEPAEITQATENPESKFKMKVVASDASNEKIPDGILLKFDIQYLSGNKTISTTPQILAKAGSEATVEIGAKDRIELKVTATRQ